METLKVIFEVVVITLAVMLPHELGHFLVGKLLRFKIVRFIICWPIGKPWLKFRLWGVPVWVYILPLAAGIEIRDRSFALAPAWRRVLMAIAGPVANLLMALLALIPVLGFERGLAYLADLANLILWFLGALIFGLTGSFGGSETIANFSYYQFALADIYMLDHGLAIYAMIQVATCILNLFPLPGLDGGWILMSLSFWLQTWNKRGRAKRRAIVKTYLWYTKFAKYRLMVYLILFYIALVGTHLLKLYGPLG